MIVRVVVPTHNRPRGLERALGSILMQGLPDLEIIVVDDASSPAVTDSLSIRDPRIQVLRNEKARGPAAARNQGALGFTYSWLAFLDDDDVWLPGKLEHCLSAIAQYPEVGLVFHRTVFADETRHGTGQWDLLEDPLRRMLTRQPPHLDSVLVRRTVHESIEFDESFSAAEDLDYLVRAAQVTSVMELDLVLAVKNRDEVSVINIEKRIAGRRRFRAKHAQLFLDRHSRTFHEIRLGHLLCLGGHRGKAFRSFARAVLTRPAEIRAWKGALRCMLPKRIVRRPQFPS